MVGGVTVIRGKQKEMEMDQLSEGRRREAELGGRRGRTVGVGARGGRESVNRDGRSDR